MPVRRTLLERFSLKERSIVITGAGRGLALSFATALAELGANIIAVDIHEQPDEELGELANYGVKSGYYKCDVRDHAALKEVIARAAIDMGSINGCICAAAIIEDKPMLETTPEDMKAAYAVVGMLSTVQICAEHMIKQGTGGAIVCISSTAGHKATFPQESIAYICSKHAVLGLVRQAGAELAKHNIRVNAISPGPFMTKMLKSLMENDSELENFFKGMNHQKRLAVPEELDGAIQYLMSDASSFVTGNSFLVDGGSNTH